MTFSKILEKYMGAVAKTATAPYKPKKGGCKKVLF
jgi:hypothetical protein